MQVQESIQKGLQALQHSYRCSTIPCPFPNCNRMRRLLIHLINCEDGKESGNCSVCKELIALICCHAKYCSDIVCLIPYCLSIQNYLKLKKQSQPIEQEVQNFHYDISIDKTENDLKKNMHSTGNEQLYNINNIQNHVQIHSNPNTMFDYQFPLTSSFGNYLNNMHNITCFKNPYEKYYY